MTTKWIVWKDEKLGFQFGPFSESKTKEIIEVCETYEDAQAAWIFYSTLLHKKLI
jgi:hypothetical protein